MTHACPVNACTIKVDSGVYMCARHWRMVPKPLQAAVYVSFARVRGISDDHLEALRVVNETEAGRGALALPPGTKAFTIWQPWASLVMLGAKPHEFRRWNFADKPHLARLIGQRIVVHAGARPVRLSEVNDIMERIEEGESALDVDKALPLLARLFFHLEHKERDEARAAAPLAAALGTVTIGEPRNVVDLFKDTVADSDRLDEHMYGWPMIDPQPFPAPIPAVGAQGFWNWS